MVTRSSITRILRCAGGMTLAACLPRLTLAQPINLQPPEPGRGVAPQPLSTPTPPQPISPDALGQAQAHLAAARVAYERGHTAEAEDAIERAETDLLNQPPGVGGARSRTPSAPLQTSKQHVKALRGETAKACCSPSVTHRAQRHWSLGFRHRLQPPRQQTRRSGGGPCSDGDLCAPAGALGAAGVEVCVGAARDRTPPSGVSAVRPRALRLAERGVGLGSRALRVELNLVVAQQHGRTVFKRADEIICRWRYGGTGSNLIHNAVRRSSTGPSMRCAMTRRYRGDKSCRQSGERMTEGFCDAI